jgi:hypothetical protein
MARVADLRELQQQLIKGQAMMLLRFFGRNQSLQQRCIN